MTAAVPEPGSQHEAQLTASTQECTASACGAPRSRNTLDTPAEVQAAWAARPISQRLAVLRRARHLLAAQAEQLAAAIDPRLSRTHADTLVTELLPLLTACRFLERSAARILRRRRLGRSGRPVWLMGVQAEVHREPLGHILIIAPSNFPLLLAGVQALQALAAGNAVTWKPGVGGAAVAQQVAACLRLAGLPEGLLTVTDESVQAARQALQAGPDKVIFTGSSRSGQAVLAELAHTATPAVVELSGADAVVVADDADLLVAARSIAFGLRLNGAEVCMSPRRLFATATTLRVLLPLLQHELASVPPVALQADTAARLEAMLQEAVQAGAQVVGEFNPAAQRPLLVTAATPGMAITRSDLFAPVLSVLQAETMLHIPAMYAQCPYALALSVFCARRDVSRALAVARTLKAGTVLINDIIVSTADPRVPFGGRGASGYGVTRGAEGLLEMTAIKTVLVRRGGSLFHLQGTTPEQTPLFAAAIGLLHGGSWAARWAALRRLITTARQLR